MSRCVKALSGKSVIFNCRCSAIWVFISNKNDDDNDDNNDDAAADDNGDDDEKYDEE